jgi:hypothetical protein
MKIKALSGPGSNDSGFTILEVVMAMGIMMVGMSVILTLLTFGAGLSRTAQLRADSAAMADAVVADLEEGLFPLLKDGSVGEPLPIEGRALPGYPRLVYSATATPNPDRLSEVEYAGRAGDRPSSAGALEYRVDVELHWKESGQKRGRGFSVLLLREVSFGARLRKQVESSY